MRGSKLSNTNLNTSKISTKLIDQTCPQHDGQPYTNFCSAMTCIKPLCPECIESHYTHHKNIRSQPQIDSFKSLKNKCLVKVAEILEHVGGDEGQNSMSQLNGIFEQSIRRVRQTRDHCKKIMETYFNNLEEFVRKKMTKIMSEQSDLFLELDKVNNIVAELRLFSNKLQNPRSFLHAAQTIIKLDGDRIQEKVKDGYSTIMRFKELHRSNLVIEKNYQQKVLNFLSNTFYYGNKENLQGMPKVVEEMAVKSHMDNLSRSRSRSQSRGGQNIENFGQQGQRSRQEGMGGTIYKESRRQEDKRSQQSQLSRKSSSKTLKNSKRQILGMNTFQSSAARKYLHFFQNDESILHYLDLEQGVDFTQIQMDINFKIPQFHKSIAISNGDLYLLGGSLSSSLKSQKIYKFDFNTNSLAYVASLKYGRSSHSICFNNRYIYVLGGFLSNQMITNRCERYDVMSGKVEEIRPMNNDCCSSACCAFGGRYVYKFGGVGDNNKPIHNIERYDQKTGDWQIINPTVDLKGQNLVELSSSAAIQITKQQMMVMGGYDENNQGYTQTYILRVEQNGQHILRDVNTFPLPLAEGFWNNNPVLHKKLIFVLQNVAYGNDECSQNLRKILSFDGGSWTILN